MIAGLAFITSITVLSSSTNVADTDHDDSGSELRILYILIAVVGSIVFAISAVLLLRCVCKVRKSNVRTFDSEIEIVNLVQSAIRNTTTEVDMTSQCRLPSQKADRTTPTARDKARAYSTS